MIVGTVPRASDSDSPIEITPRLSWLWPAVVAAIFTLVMLAWSRDRFRLTCAPFLDDVNWMDTGLGMLGAMRDGGASGLFHYVAETRTLAPYSMVAAVGFAVFGIRDWAPYAMNGWLVFCLLGFVELARRRARLPARAWFLGAAVALAFPITGYSVVSFLGDCASGLFIAIGAAAFLGGWPSSKSRLESWAGTLAWIFAFYGKATLSPETGLVFALTATAGCWIAVREAGEAGAAIRKWAWRAGVVIAAVLPYYLLVARDLYNYLYDSNYGAFRQVWAFKGKASESLLFYLTGFSGETMLGPALYLAAALVLIRGVALRRERAAEKLRFRCWLGLLAITYALPTWMVNKTPTVGSPFQFLVVLTAVGCCFEILRRRRGRAPAFEIAVALAAVLLLRFPQALDRRDSAAVVARNRTLEGLMAALTAQDLKKDEPVFLTSTGYVSPNTLTYEFLKRGLPLPRFFELAVSKPDASGYPAMIRQAAFVIATDAGNDEVFYTAPWAFVQGETLAMVQADAAFAEVARFSTWRGKHYYLFGRRERVKSVGPEAPAVEVQAPGPVWARGFSAPGADGWRWSRREFEIEFPAPRGLYAELKLRFFVPQQAMEKLGPVKITAEIPHEGRGSETVSKEGVHELTYRYAIKQHLVSTVRVRFRVNKAMRASAGSSEENGVLCETAELNPAPQM